MSSRIRTERLSFSAPPSESLGRCFAIWRPSALGHGSVRPGGTLTRSFIRREDAERFVNEVRGDDPEIAAKLRIEERELEAGGLRRYGS